MSGKPLAMANAQTGLQPFPVTFAPPDLTAWRGTNCGVPGFWRFTGPGPGPNLVITALIHGNEIAGAVVLNNLLQQTPKPLCGTLTCGFVNLAAFDAFDPAHPTASRYIDEDMNRLWDIAVLEGGRQSCELTRARAIRPLIDQADILLDLHSMLWPSEPLILSGPTPRGRRLAASLGTPGLVVADHGHAGGKRLIDYAPFVDQDSTRCAVLVEAGQHWQPETLPVMHSAITAALAIAGLTDAPKPTPTRRFAEVTHAVTADTGSFSFVRPFSGGDIVPRRNTLIATDGGLEIRTPYDQCLLIMPSLRPSRGHTAVRLATYTET